MRRSSNSSGVGELLAMISPAGPWAIRAAATLRLADLIGSGISQLEDIAIAANVNADALGRLLRFLTSRGIFVELNPDRFEVNAAARLLMEAHPAKLRSWLDLDGAGARMDEVWPALLYSLRTGGPAYPSIHGQSFWDDLVVYPELASSFDSLMALGSTRIARDVVSGYDWSKVRHVVDIGGGNGALMAELLAARSELQGTVLDLPATAALAEAHLSARGLSNRCSVIGGSFLDPLPIRADVYILANVLHDWNDEDALKILNHCASVVAEGRVLIVERIRSSTNARDSTEDDLRFLLLFGGRARTMDQFHNLTSAAGLRITFSERTASGVSLLECALARP